MVEMKEAARRWRDRAAVFQATASVVCDVDARIDAATNSSRSAARYRTDPPTLAKGGPPPDTLHLSSLFLLQRRMAAASAVVTRRSDAMSLRCLSRRCRSRSVMGLFLRRGHLPSGRFPGPVKGARHQLSSKPCFGGSRQKPS